MKYKPNPNTPEYKKRMAGLWVRFEPEQRLEKEKKTWRSLKNRIKGVLNGHPYWTPNKNFIKDLRYVFTWKWDDEKK